MQFPGLGPALLVAPEANAEAELIFPMPSCGELECLNPESIAPFGFDEALCECRERPLGRSYHVPEEGESKTYPCSDGQLYRVLVPRALGEGHHRA